MRPTSRWWILIVLPTAAAGALLAGMTRWPTSAAQGGPLLPPADSKPGNSPPVRLRIAVFNVHSGVGKDDRRDLARTARVLNGFDLIGLHEVSGDGPWSENDASDLAKRLDMTGCFLPTERHWGFRAFGNAVLTRTPINCWATTPLPNGYHMANRIMTRLEVPFGSGILNVLIVHLGKKSDRATQFGVVRDAFDHLPEPAILMGDLNTRPTDRLMEDLLRDGRTRDLVGEKIEPQDRVDYILARGVRCADAGLLVNDASDHPAAWAEIEALP